MEKNVGGEYEKGMLHGGERLHPLIGTTSKDGGGSNYRGEDGCQQTGFVSSVPNGVILMLMFFLRRAAFRAPLELQPPERKTSDDDPYDTGCTGHWG